MSCRSAAYRARKAGKQPGRAEHSAGSDAAPPESPYGSIPREVLDILAKYFGQRDEIMRAELAAAQRRVAEMQRALEDKVSAEQRKPEEAQVPLVAAQERIRKLTEELERTRAESVDRSDKLATRIETLSRQKQAATDELAQRDEALRTLRAELQSAQERLTQAAEQSDAHAKQLNVLERAVAQQQERCRQLDERATANERFATELQGKLAEAEERAGQAEDESSEQTLTIARLEEALAEAEKRQQATQRSIPRGEEYAALQRQVAGRHEWISQQDAEAKARLSALAVERDELAAECATHREHAAQQVADSGYDAVTSRAVEMARALLVNESPSDQVSIHRHLQRFDSLIRWSAGWLMRRFLRVLVVSDSSVQLEAWATHSALELGKESAQWTARFPDGLANWAEANPALLSRIALCAAASTASRVLHAMPTQLQAAQANASPRVVSGRALAAAPPPPAITVARPEPTPEIALPRPREPSVPAPAPASPEPMQRPTRGRATREPKPVAASVSWEEQFQKDRLARIKMDLLSVSNQLAELQDLMTDP